MSQPQQEHPLSPTLQPAEVLRRQRARLIRVVRIVFVILIATFTATVFYQVLDLWGVNARGVNSAKQWWLPMAVALGIVGVVVAIDMLTPMKKLSTIVGVLIGLVMGLLATLMLGGLLDLLLQGWIDPAAMDYLRPAIQNVKIVLGICLGYLGVVTVLQTKDDFRLLLPYIEFSKQIRGVRPILLDSSVLIDGRIVEIAHTNFIQSPLVIPNFVIGELQTLADSGDALKRAKGRRGLDMIGKLQRLGNLDVTIDETPATGVGVDQMLLDLAKTLGVPVMTTDSALARIAGIQRVPVLNLHELSTASRSTLLQGQTLTLEILRRGEQAGQGVGFLPDGVMVVVENGEGLIGTTVEVTVTGSLQTNAGRLVFARAAQATGSESDDRPGTPVDDAPVVPQPQTHDTGQGEEEASSEGAADRPRPHKPYRPAASPRNPRR
jgi:uncharacterized protein YacL